EVEYLPVDSNATVSVDAFRERVRPDTRLAAVILVNHETGTIEPVSELRVLVPIFHCDAAQAVGKIPVSFRKFGVTSLSLSAHKFGGPKGVGALVLKNGTQLISMFFGGHQQQGRRPGTETPMLAVGMAKALEISSARMDEANAALSHKRRSFVERLR